MPKRIFKSFEEFYSLTRLLSDEQRHRLFRSLPAAEQADLDRACRDEGWEDLLIVNRLDELVDQIKEKHEEDLLLIRVQVVSGKPKKLRREFWDHVRHTFSVYSTKHTWYIFGGMHVVDVDDDYIILVPSKRRNNGKEI